MSSSTKPTTGNNTAPPTGQNSPERAHLYGLLLAGTMTGLPIPASVSFDNGGISVTLDKDDRAGVDRWAAFFGVPAASIRNYSGDFSYTAFGNVGDGPTQWRAARCYINQTDAEQAEVTR
ncbi:hypothetical protein ABNF97_09535 [Plantactinospora sp. B6F1]|uniref:hypothetical protein n=1 Tax=Plantactinospora sp. B6F1 TaxID=3158971 RepID=UPI0032D902E7